MDKDLNVLQHMVEYCEDIKNDSKRLGDDYEIFKSDRLFQKAITMSLLQIGELTTHLSDEFKNDTAGEMDWRNIKGLRNLLAHRYGTMDISLVWDIKEKDINLLREFCDKHIDLLKNAELDQTQHKNKGRS